MSAASVEGGALLSVGDTGDGIAAEHLPHVFERLYVARHRPADRESGSGLGLAIVKHILEAHGQRLEVESRVGYGSAFGFALPVAPQGFGAPQNAAPMVVGTSNG